MKITKLRLKEIIREEIKKLNEVNMVVFLQSFGFKTTDMDNGVQFLIHKGKKLDAWNDYKTGTVMVGRQNGRDNKVFRGSDDKKLSQYLQKKFKLKSSEPSWNEGKLKEVKLNEAKRRELEIHVRDKIKVDKILKKLRLKSGKDYDIGFGSSRSFLLDIDIKYLDKLITIFMKNRIDVKEL